jgi:hypothetical protein
MTTNKTNAYAALKAAADERGLPRRHAADLTKHDRAWCDQHVGSPFAWLLYEHGTHLVVPRDPTDYRAQRLAGRRTYTADEMARIVHECAGDGAAQWFWWNGHALRVSSLGEVEDLLVAEEQRMADEHRARFAFTYAEAT